jgi:hypothetical protein
MLSSGYYCAYVGRVQYIVEQRAFVYDSYEMWFRYKMPGFNIRGTEI